MFENNDDRPENDILHENEEAGGSVEDKKETAPSDANGEIKEATAEARNTEGTDNSFGVAYFPEKNNSSQGVENGYRINSYSYSDNSNQDNRSFANGSAQMQKTKKPKKDYSAAILAVVVVCCILFSAVAAIGGTLFARRFIITAPHYADSEVNKAPSTGDAVELLKSNSDRNVITRVVAEGEEMTFTEAAAKVKDSVVEITTESVTSDFFFGGEYITGGAGSGVIISSSGYIITNNHVIESATKIRVRLTDKTEYEATVIGADQLADIAVIKINPEEGKELNVAVFGDSKKVMVGQYVLAIGNPLGKLGGSVTHGIISALDREISVDGNTMTLIQTDASINPGNSGGGLFNLYGELVGVVNAKSSGSNIEGLGFVIPANDAQSVASQLIEYGYVRGRPMLDIKAQDFDSFNARYYFGVKQAGLYVYEDNDEVGVKSGDRIISINDTEVTCRNDASDILMKCSVGETVKMVVMRNGKTVEVNVTLKERIPENIEQKK